MSRNLIRVLTGTNFDSRLFPSRSIACRRSYDRLCTLSAYLEHASRLTRRIARKRMFWTSPSLNHLQRWPTAAPGRAARATESRVCASGLGTVRAGRLRRSGAWFLLFPARSRPCSFRFHHRLSVTGRQRLSTPFLSALTPSPARPESSHDRSCRCSRTVDRRQLLLGRL